MRWGAALETNVIIYSRIFNCTVNFNRFPFSVGRLQFSDCSSCKEQKQNSQELNSYFQRSEGRKPLPLPPVLNPAILAAQKRYRQPKSKPSGKDRTEFQQRLYRNPYAWALASRPRSCRGTAIRIPSYFTVTFQPGLDPETNNVVFLPNKNIQKTGLNVRLLATYDNISEVTTQPDYVSTQLTGHWLDKKRKPQWTERIPDQTTEMLRLTFIKSLKWALKHPKSGLVEGCKGALSITTSSDKKETEWDGDRVHARSAGPAAVLYLVSRIGLAHRLCEQYMNISKELEVISHEVGKLVRKINGIGKPKQTLYRYSTIPRSLPLGKLRERFPVVWYQDPAFEGSRDDNYQQQLQMDSLTNSEPARRPVPVYDLPFLLGKDGVQQLLQDTVFKNSHCLILKDVRLNLECQMHLYKLHGYLSMSED